MEALLELKLLLWVEGHVEVLVTAGDKLLVSL